MDDHTKFQDACSNLLRCLTLLATNLAIWLSIFVLIFVWKNFCGFLPSKQVHMDKGQFPIFARAFAGLLYAPSVAMCLVLSKHVHTYSGKNVKLSYLQNRCIFSSYCDVVTVYNKFGPILPVPTFFKNDKEYSQMKRFYELMTTDVFCRNAPSSRDNKSKQFHSYVPGGISGPDSKDHFSSNVPNFVSLICLAMHLYELNDALYRKAVKDEVEDPLSNLLFPLMSNDDDAYIVLTNKIEIRKLFDKRTASAPSSSDPVASKDEKYFRQKYFTNRGLLKNEFTTLCYVKDVKPKIMFMRVGDWKKDPKDFKKAKSYSLVELCDQVFNVNCDVGDDESDECPLCYMDASFDLIVEHFRSEDKNLIEFLRTTTKIIEDTKLTNNLVASIFRDAAGKFLYI